MLEFAAPQRELIQPVASAAAYGLNNLNFYVRDERAVAEDFSARGFTFWSQPTQHSLTAGVGNPIEVIFDGPDGVAMNLVELTSEDPATRIGQMRAYVERHGYTRCGFTPVVTTSHICRDMVAARRFYETVLRMGALIDSLLELARIGRAELRPANVDVSLLAEWVAAELQDAQPQRPARVRVQPGLDAIGDERLLKALLTQLLRNAWQFSAACERVEIDVEGMRDADGLHFVVRDRGIGFDMAYAGKLFEPFQRLHGSEQGAGHGIGLTIAQQAAARHGGTIRAEAGPGPGASFHVALRDLALPAQERARDNTETRAA